MKYFLSFVILLFLHNYKVNFIKDKSIADKVQNLQTSSITPPGTLNIGDNLYFDIAEVSNQNYLEFLNWTAVVYGKNANEYKEILPKTDIWRSLGRQYKALDKYYLRHPKFSHYPVVGLTYEQAKKFSKWRSDRVMELILVRNGVFEQDQNPTSKTFFTIEKYFKGLYKNIKPDPRFMKYPHYSLPDKETYQKAFTFSDAGKKYSPKAQPPEYRAKLLLKIFKSSNLKASKLSGSIPEAAYQENKIIDLNSNVREYTNTKGVVYGNSFIDSIQSSEPIFQKSTQNTNIYTGFRNMCTYKKWED